jgi:glycosyltransferase involved in cell wall biosynthesis
MNIAFVLPYWAERFGGPVTMVKNIGGTLAAKGHNISYWASTSNSDREDTVFIDSAHLYNLSWPRSWYRSKGLAHGLSVEAGSFDIMHINGFWAYSVYMASRIACVNSIPYLLRPAGCLEPWPLRRNYPTWLKKAIYLNLIGKFIMRGATCLHAASTQEAEHFRQVGFQGPITVIANGVDSSEFTSGDGLEAETYWPKLKNRPVVLFMSRLSPEKGLDVLIPVWADIVKSQAYKEAMLVIAGPDDRGYRKVVEGIIDRYDMDSKVLLTDIVFGREKLALLRRADIFILPSYSENFGIVVPEALACGTPVITTTATPWEQLQDVGAGYWVPPRGPELGQALRELLDMSEAERTAMGKRGRILVLANYTWDISARKMITVYRCIIEGREIPLHPEPMELNME